MTSLREDRAIVYAKIVISNRLIRQFGPGASDLSGPVIFLVRLWLGLDSMSGRDGEVIQ